MFHNMPQAILDRMRELEQIDVLDRAGGTARMKRLRQIPPEVGRFIALLAAAAPDGRCIEIGTSAGYSTLWLPLSCRAKGRKVTTFEVQDEKAKLASELLRAGDRTLLAKARTLWCPIDAQRHRPVAVSAEVRARFSDGGTGFSR